MQLSSLSLALTRAGVVRAYTPSGLFANGEQGVWYDPSDMSTMFQDSAGTTPVTAVEQPVGRILDKSGRGNHATQTTTTSRPVLSARVNLLSNTEAFDTASWAKLGSNVVVNSTQAPNGTLTADNVRLNAGTAVTTPASGLFTSGSASLVSQSTITALSATNYIFSIYVKAASGITHAQLRVATNSALTNNLAAESVVSLSDGAVISGGATVTNAGDGWWRVSLPFTATAAVYFCGLWFWNSTSIPSATGTEGVYVWGADLRVANVGTNLPAYQRVNTATDYDTAGFPMYLRFDGVDDWLVTPSINFTSTDKMTVFAGVRKLSDAAAGTIVELSSTPTAADVTARFSVTAAASSLASYGLGMTSNNGASGTYQIRALTYTAPITNVVSAQFDSSLISGSGRAVSRINAAAPGSIEISFEQNGTGPAVKFGAFPLYIGRRGGTTLPFNGHLYSLIVRGAQSTAQQITQTEQWVNGKTKAY